MNFHFFNKVETFLHDIYCKVFKLICSFKFHNVDIENEVDRSENRLLNKPCTHNPAYGSSKRYIEYLTLTLNVFFDKAGISKSF